jgi:hypothetical protein
LAPQAGDCRHFDVLRIIKTWKLPQFLLLPGTECPMPKISLSDPGHMAKMPAILGGSYLDAATTDHEHDQGGFPNPRPGHGSLPVSAFSFDNSFELTAERAGSFLLRIDQH